MHISFIPQDASPSSPAWMFGFDPDKCSVGVGLFAFDKPALEAYRQRVCGEDGAKLKRLLARLSGKGIRLSEPELKRIPRGFDDQSGAHDLLRHKGLTGWIEYQDPTVVTKAGIVSSCLSDFKRLQPLFNWLDRA